MRRCIFPVLVFGLAMLLSGNAAAADHCPLEFGSQTFESDGTFVPPVGTSAACPLQVRVFLIGGGGNGGTGSLPDNGCAVGGGGGGSGRVAAAQLNVTAPIPVIVGRAGQESRFGAILVAAGGDDGRNGSDGGGGGEGASQGGQAGSKGQTNGAYDSGTKYRWDGQVVHNRERYQPNSVNGLMFPSVRIVDGPGGQAGAQPSCGKSGGGGAGGFLLDYLGPHAVQSDAAGGMGGAGYGAGGGGGMSAGGAGAPGVVYVEW